MKLNITNYKNLLSSFNLVEFWEEELRVNDYKRNQRALRVLDDLGDNVPGSIITRKVHNTNNELRKNAKSLSMKFSSYDSFKYLEDDFDKNLNELDKVRIHSALKENAKHKPLPLLIRWVKLSKNEKFKTFLIKEMGFFK